MLSWMQCAPSHEGDSSGTLLFATRRRVLELTSTLAFVVAFAWVALTSGTVTEGRPLVAVLSALAPLLFLSFPFLARRNSINLDLLAHAFLTLFYLTATIAASALGGMVSTTSFFIMLIPMLATLLLGLRAGLIWFAIVVLTYAALHIGRGALPTSAYEALGTYPADWMRAQDVSLWNAYMMIVLALSAAIAVANFRVAAQKSSAMLVQSALEKRDAMEALVAAEKISRAKSGLVASVSHEFRTPLNAIIGYTELLLENAQDQDRREDAADSQRVLDGATRLLSMVNNMLRLSAIDAGRHKVRLDECDINALVRDAVIVVTPQVEANGNVLSFEPHGEAGFWVCDGPKLADCLKNLLSNAAQFTHDGEILVRASMEHAEDRTWLQLEVSDNGVGIEPSLQETIFIPFGLTDADTPQRRSGIGLGLAVTRQLAQLMGGDVAVKSATGCGSHFTLRVPAEFLADAPESGSVVGRTSDSPR